MKSAVNKRQTEKDVSKVKDRRQGISAGKKAKACKKEERGRSIYTMALMTSNIYDAGGRVIADIVV